MNGRDREDGGLGGKINVYGLGVKGVNVTKSPIHLDESEIVSAQNAVFDTENLEGGLAMRKGFAKLNSAALAGSVQGMIGVPLPATITRTLYYSLKAASGNGWRKTTDGVTFADAPVLGRVAQPSKFGAATTYLTPWQAAVYNGRLYYPGDDYTLNSSQPTVRVYDSLIDQDYKLFDIPLPVAGGAQAFSQGITSIILHNEKIYVAVYDNSNGTEPYGRIFEFNPITQTVTQVGNAFGLTQTAPKYTLPPIMVSHQGYLWIAGFFTTTGGGTATISRIRPGIDRNWSVVASFDLQMYPTAAASYKGELYIATYSDAISHGKVYRLSTGNVLTTSDQFTAGLGGATGNGYYGLCVFNGELYASNKIQSGGSQSSVIRKFNGSTWATDVDVTATLAKNLTFQTTPMAVFQNALFVLITDDSGGADSCILKRTTGGTWSVLEDAQEAWGHLGELVTIS